MVGGLQLGMLAASKWGTRCGYGTWAGSTLSDDSYSALAVGTSCEARVRTTSSMDRQGGFLSCSPSTRPKMRESCGFETSYMVL
jgi:hypothetical protein